jgi:C4-dicarboxylate-specific signal transduction histidine kinase
MANSLTGRSVAAGVAVLPRFGADTGASTGNPQVPAPAGDGGVSPAIRPSLKPHLRRWTAAMRGYGISLLLVAAALGASLLLQHSFAHPFFLLFFAAVMSSSWIGGNGPGLFSVLLSTLAVGYFLVPPYYSFTISAAEESYFVSFIVCAFVASWVSSVKRHSEQVLKQARDLLEIRVAERTAQLEKSNADLQERERRLTHLARILSLGELTSSIAHEVNQPLTAVVTYGHACVEWLSANPPNVEEGRKAAERIIQDGTRAGAVLQNIRAMFKKETVVEDALDMNAVISDLTVFLRDEAARQNVSLRTDLLSDLPRVRGDRVQLQQVVLNLMLNAMDAMIGIDDRPRELMVSSRRGSVAEVLIRVEDSGVGLSPQTAENIFHPFFTTKAHGIGMGLSISRSIVEAHEGRLWATPRPSGGAIFQFTLPIGS